MPKWGIFNASVLLNERFLFQDRIFHPINIQWTKFERNLLSVLFQRNYLKHLSWNGQHCYASVNGDPLPFPVLVEKSVKQLHVCPADDLQYLCWDVSGPAAVPYLTISQLLDSSLNLLLCGCTTVNG